MGDWVETASKRAQRIEESPAAVSVITAEEIKHSGATTLGDVLRRVPGLEVMILNASDTEIGARGQNKPLSNGILVLVNGRTVYQDFFGMVLWNKLSIALEDIEKIEVVRGPGSVLYGANALHAVVNIITKKPGSYPGASGSLTAGPDVLIGTAVASGRTGALSYWGSAGWTQFSSFSNHEKVVLQYPRGRLHFARNFENIGEVEFEAGINSGAYNAFYDIVGTLNSYIINNNIGLRYSRPNFYIRSFWKMHDAPKAYFFDILLEDLELFGMPLPLSLAEGWDFDIELINHVIDTEVQKIFELPADNLLTLGGSYRYNTILTNICEDRYTTQNLVGAYLQHEFQYRDLVHTYLGARYDYHPLTENTLSPRGSVLISPLPGHTFRLSGGKSFRNPTFIESKSKISVALMVMGSEQEVIFASNPDLDPEELTSFEVGYQTSLIKNKLSASVNTFYNLISGLINIVMPDGFTALEASFANMLDEEAMGMEAEVRYRPYSWLSAFANYTITKVTYTRMLHEGAMTDVDQLIEDEEYRFFTSSEDKRTPRHKLNLGATAILSNGFSSTLLIHHVGETYWPPNVDRDIGFMELGPTDAYTLVNLRIGYAFPRPRIETSLNIFNLLNQEHRQFPLSEEIGQRITGNIRVTF